MLLKKWIKLWMYTILGCLIALPIPAGTARPRFDTSTDMGLVLVPADAEIESVIFRLRATDQDADFPLIFDITATVTPIVRIENLPCTLYNKVCQANVILTRRLVPGRLHDFAVRVKDSKGDSNSMQATISVTNATTQRDKIFPHIPAIIMVPEDSKPGKELDYLLVRSNQWSGKPVYIELWQPKELFTIRQRQTPAETRGVITLIGELDFETQSMYTLTIYATDPYTEPKKDTRNIAGLQLVVIVQDVQDVPPIFTLAPPLTKINNTIQPGDMILRVHAEDGDKGVPREVTYGLVSEGNPFTPFFNISETTGEIILARPLEELTQITHVGAPVVLSVVAEEIRRSTSEPPAQATVVEVGLLLGEPGNSPPLFENDNYVAWIDENADPGSTLIFTEHYSTRVHDEDIGKAGVFALKLYNNNGTFEINPAVAERIANFIITVRDNSLIDYEMYKSLRFEIIAQEVGPATNLSTIVPVTIFIRDVNDNAPEFDSPTYEVTLSEDVAAGTRVVQVHATDKDTGSFGRIQYTRIIGPGNEAFVIDSNTGIITVAMGNSILDREITASLELSIEARDEDGKGLRGIVPLVVNLLDVNDNAPIFEMENYEFTLNEDSSNFSVPAIIKAFDADAEPPNNAIRYEIVHGNYENKFFLNEITGELLLREPINKIRRTRQNPYKNFATKLYNNFIAVEKTFENMIPSPSSEPEDAKSSENSTRENVNRTNDEQVTNQENHVVRKKRENDDVIFTLTARAYDLGVPHLSGVTRINVMKGPVAGARIVSFVVPGENPDPVKTAETLAAITGGRVTVQEIRPYTIKDVPKDSGTNVPNAEGEKKSIVVARVEPNNGGTSLVDIERIQAALAANGVGVIGGGMPDMETGGETKSMDNGATSHNTNTNTNITNVYNEEVTVYRAENRLLFWLLIILGLLMLLALIALIICCICPGCPFYMAPRKRRVHSSETLVTRSDGRPKRHLHRKHARLMEASWPVRKQAWSADPMRRNWQFNRRNQKAGGLASLPGDVRVIDRERDILEKTGSLRLRDGPPMMYTTTEHVRRPDEEKIYIEDVDGARARGYVDSFHQQDPELGLENVHQAYVNRDEQRGNEQSKFVREQHYYRDGNAEILRLVTRGQMEEGAISHPAKRPQTLVLEQGHLGVYRNDGKEILLQRFIEDQKNRHASSGQDLHDSFQDIEHRSMESHHRRKDTIDAQAAQKQQKILLLPERLEDDHRQHIEELGPEVQRLIIDHGDFEKSGRFEGKESQEFVQGGTILVPTPIIKASSEQLKEESSKQNVNLQTFSIHDLELARQNALLTRLLLGKDGRDVAGGAMVDSASYLETQSLPGQVAIATQTDRTAATQTELPNRSRSDNDESEEEARIRKKLKSKKRYTDTEPRRIKTLWIKSPIEEEEMQYGTEKRTIFLRKKIRDVKDSRRISLEADVLREISDSLDETGDAPITARKREETKKEENSNSKEESRTEDDNEKLEESSSTEMVLTDGRRIDTEKGKTRRVAEDDSKRKSHRGKRDNIIEPSFRILEKEMSSLSKKLSKLTGKKILQYSNGSETDSQEAMKTTAMTNLKKTDKKTHVVEIKNITKQIDITKATRSKSKTRTVDSGIPIAKDQSKGHDEIVDSKIRQTSKYRKNQNISTGSSDFEDTTSKLKTTMPLVTHAERQRQVPTKSSYSKSKRQSRQEHKDMAKLGTHPQDASEGKDTSDTASKESIKSHKNERDLTKIKKYSSGIIEGQIDHASGSASSDSFKDKRSQRKEGSTLDKRSVAEVNEKKTEFEHTSGSPSSDHLDGKLHQEKSRPMLDRKCAVDYSDGKTESEQTSDGPASKNSKLVTIRQKGGPILEPKRITAVHPKEIKSEQSGDSANSNNGRDEIIKHQENSVHIDKASPETLAVKKDSGHAGDIIDAAEADDTTKEKNERLALESISSGDNIKEKTEIELQSASTSLDNLKDKTPLQAERLVLDRTSILENNTIEATSGENSERLHSYDPQDETLRKTKEVVFLESKSYELVSDVLNSIRLQDETSQMDQRPPDKVLSVEAGERMKREPEAEITREDTSKSDEANELDANLQEIQQKSPETPGLKLSEDSVAVEELKSESPEKERKKVIDVTSVTEKSEESIKETVGSIEEKVLEIPKEKIVDFLDHEIKDSTQTLQNTEATHYSIAEEAEKVKELILGSMLMEPVSETAKSFSETEKISDSTTVEISENVEKLSETPLDKSEVASKLEKEKIVQQTSEDGETFSDNFDSFCGTDMISNDPELADSSKDEIPYETLQSESSADQIPEDDIKDAVTKDEEKVENTEESPEKTINSQIIATAKASESQKSISATTIPSEHIDTSTKLSPKTASLDDRTSPTPQDLVPTESNIEKEAAAANEKSETKSELEQTMEESIAASTDYTIQPQNVPETEQPDAESSERQVDLIPIVPPLEIQTSDEKIVPLAKVPGQTPENIDLETLSQKEFGIADSLFVDAKILTTFSSPRNVIKEITEKVPPEETFSKEESTINVPPINLAELSRVMLEDANDSDSSEASGKIMLTARPYGTPRHRSVSGSGDAKPDESSSVSIETVAVDADESAPNPEKVDNDALPAEKTEQMVTQPVLVIETKPGTPSEIAGGTGTIEKLIPEVSPNRLSPETLKTEAVESVHVSDRDVKKLEAAGKEMDAGEDPSEKVQLSQIRQKTLPTEPDGFASLPETSKPVKSLDDTTDDPAFYPKINTLPEEVKKEDTQEHISKVSNVPSDGTVSLPKSESVHERTKEKTSAAGTSVSREEMKLPIKLSKEGPSKHGVKVLGDEIKNVPRAKHGTRKAMKKRDGSNDTLPKTGKTGVSSLKAAELNKDKKIKVQKDESAKLGKPAMMLKQTTRPRDTKHQGSSSDLRTETQTNIVTRADQTRHKSKKMQHLHKDDAAKDLSKIEKPKKKSKAEDEKIESSANRDKLKTSRGKKIQKKETKMSSSKIMSLPEKMEEMDYAEATGGADFESQLMKETEKDITSRQEEKETMSSIENNESKVPMPQPTSETLIEDFQKEMIDEVAPEAFVILPENEETLSDSKHKTQSTKEQAIKSENLEQVDADARVQDSMTANDKVEPAEVRSDPTISTEPEPSEIILDSAADPESRMEAIRLEQVDDQPETENELKREAGDNRTTDSIDKKLLKTGDTSEKTRSPKKFVKSKKEIETVTIESQSRYMEWYKLKREEMERKRQERKEGDEEETRPKWLRKRTRQRWIKVNPEDRRIFDPQMADTTPFRRRKIKPLVNVESEQLKAIVLQGRKLRKAQGENADEPQIQIYAPEKPPSPLCAIPTSSRYHHHHHLVQHSEYKYEKMPLPPFYLHSPPVFAASPQMSPQKFDEPCSEQQYSSLPADSACPHDIYDSSIAHHHQQQQQQQPSTNNKLRHGELLEKKSVFDIAYSEAAPPQLRSDSTTPPS